MLHCFLDFVHHLVLWKEHIISEKQSVLFSAEGGEILVLHAHVEEVVECHWFSVIGNNCLY